MDDAAFEDLELHVLTLAFQIEGLKKNATINKQRNSLKMIEEDYRYYKRQYDQQVKKNGEGNSEKCFFWRLGLIVGNE